MSKRKLLLADDSVTIQKVVNLTFADEGIDVITVGDGNSAMSKISESIPDVVLADVHMPGLNGYQICEMLRSNEATRDLPVVLLVGSFEPFDENEAARVGANAFLTKPFQSIRQLVSQVSELIESRAEPDVSEEPTASFIEPAAVEPEPAAYHEMAFDNGMPVQGETVPAVRDTSDIESLYERSLGEPESEGSAPLTVDAGMDDEMIEVSHSAVDEGENGWAATPAYSEPPPSEEPAYAAVEQHDEQPAYQNSPFDSTVDVDHAHAAASAAAAPAYEGEETEAQFEATHRFDESVETTDEFTLNEADILELPPIEDGKTIEFTTTESGSREVVSLSPELMEILVQKVVDRLSRRS